MYWEIKEKNKTKDGKVLSIEVVDAEYRDAEVSFKWDGCVDYRKYSNGITVDDDHTEEKEKNTNYIHICEIDGMIERLQEIKRIAEENFDSKDFKFYWNN